MRIYSKITSSGGSVIFPTIFGTKPNLRKKAGGNMDLRKYESSPLK